MARELARELLRLAELIYRPWEAYRRWEARHAVWR